MDAPAPPSKRGDTPLTFFAYAGWIVGALLAVTLAVRLSLGDRGWMFKWQLIAVGLVTLVFLAVALLRTLRVSDRSQSTLFQRMERVWHPVLTRLRFLALVGNRSAPALEIDATPLSLLQSVAAWMGAAAVIVTSLAVLFLAHRALFVVCLAVLQAMLLLAICRGNVRTRPAYYVVLFITAWGLTSGLTYTHLADWLLNGTHFSSFALMGFIMSFVLVTYELHDDTLTDKKVRWLIPAALLCLCTFAAFSLRTDNLMANWVPIHRSYFADIAQFVRDGHWLLWDVPSLYGFLSILLLAIIPAANGWQALYELTAIFLFLEAAMVFTVLRWGRSGWASWLFAALLVLGTIYADNLALYPWSARLYPQGGMRFFWPSLLLFTAFLMYAWRSKPFYVRALRVFGYAVWLIATLWSVESLLWSTVIWGGFVVADVITKYAPLHKARVLAGRLVVALLPFGVLLAAAALVITWIYHARLGAGPDWMGFIEFAGLFTSGIKPIIFVQPYGAGWLIMVILGAAGTVGLGIVAARKWDALPLASAAWLATWAVSSYYALEPLDMYIPLMMAVLTLTASVVIYLSREALASSAAARFARLSLAPFAIIAIAFALGDGKQILNMQLPFFPGWTFETTQQVQPISGELGELFAQAGVQPEDAVLIPTGPYWTELSQGLILPFGRRRDGTIFMYHSWLPVSPAPATLLTNALPEWRRRTYIERFLALTGKAGWYATYRSAANCAGLSPRLFTVKRYASRNFSLSLCALRAEGAVTREFTRSQSSE